MSLEEDVLSKVTVKSLHPMVWSTVNSARGNNPESNLYTTALQFELLLTAEYAPTEVGKSSLLPHPAQTH